MKFVVIAVEKICRLKYSAILRSGRVESKRSQNELRSSLIEFLKIGNIIEASSHNKLEHSTKHLID
jgi:hypothetical protein